jgi:hypothetical protein
VSERIAKAQRAQMAYDEFIAPMLAETRDVYSARMLEVAVTELSRDARTDKLTCLATAIRILDELETGIKGVMMDGDVALTDKLRAEKIEQMTPAQRRIFGLVPTR